MALRRLVNIMARFAAGDNPQTVRNDMPVGRGPSTGNTHRMRQATVMAVGLTTIVKIDNRLERVGQATDEPLRAGQRVWVVPVEGGGVAVVGSVK